MAELRCASCHAFPEAWSGVLTPSPGPDLSRVGSRLNPDALWRMIRSPQHAKKGTQMPGLFTGEEGDDEDVEALTEFLASLQRPKHLAMPDGDAESGRRLYHQTGCVACHEPAADYRPPTIPPDAEVDKPGLPSVPIALANAFDPSELARFLLQPLESRPSGRMPAQLHSAQEAADVAAYLQFGETREPSTERAILNIPPQGIDRGRAVFFRKRCDACHNAGVEAPPNVSPRPAASALDLDSTRGCLDSERASSVPFFDLSELQRRALRLALRALSRSGSPGEYVGSRLDFELTRLNCYACHDRDGKGGPEDPRAQYFSQKAIGGLPGFHPFPIPPSLDGAESRLSRAELLNSLMGKPPASDPQTDVRMPDFGQPTAEKIAEFFPSPAR